MSIYLSINIYLYLSISFYLSIFIYINQVSSFGVKRKTGPGFGFQGSGGYEREPRGDWPAMPMRSQPSSSRCAALGVRD